MGISVEQRLCPQGVHSYDTCEWDRRSVSIQDAQGNVVFEQDDCEFPVHFSPLSGQIVAGKYFRGGARDRETSLRDVISRIVLKISEWGRWNNDRGTNYFASFEDAERFEDELSYILLHQYACFNSPVLFNLGVPSVEQQASACFILEARDTIEDWFRVVKEEGLIFKRGSGSGLDLSPIRSSWDHLSGGGRPSGPISLMKILDTNAGQIKSGGRVRRAAKMHVLRADHPDIWETREGTPGFINCKLAQEQIAFKLIDAGLDGGFNVPGGAYEQVFFQNANHSVRATDEFFEAVEQGGRWLTFDRLGNEIHKYEAQALHLAVCQAAWGCGDPAYQYDNTIQEWHTVPNSGPITASNPCSEFLHLNNTSCNLYSIRLTKFLLPDGTFDMEMFEHVCQVLTLAGEIIVGGADYPTETIKQETRRCRPLGLGYCDLGALLMRLGLPYDSDEARALAGAITSLMAAAAYEISAQISALCGGPFEYFEANREPMLAVIMKHNKATRRLLANGPLVSGTEVERILCRALNTWISAGKLGEQFGFRNSQVTVIAPTGTISFWMGADTTGVEPDISLLKVKELAGGGRLTYVNESVEAALWKLGYPVPDIEAMLEELRQEGNLENSAILAPEHLPVFDCAFTPQGGSRSIHHMGHLKMMAAVQPFVSGAISKTVNLPNTATVEDISEVYLSGWKLGLKCVAVYRDGCKRSQPLAAGKGKKKNVEPEGLKCFSCGTAVEHGEEKCFVCPNCGAQAGCSV